LTDGVVSNAYDENPALQPPFRTLRVAQPDDTKAASRSSCSTTSRAPEPVVGPDGTTITPPLKSREELAASLYRGVAMSLHPHVDAYLCESLSNIRAAETIARAAMSTERNVYVSFKLSSDDYGVPRLLSCETLAQAVDRLLHVLPRFVSGYSVNCSSPAIITAALPLLRSITQKPIGAYAKLPYSVKPDRRRPGLAGQGRKFEHEHASTASPLIARDNTLETLGRQMQRSQDERERERGGAEAGETLTTSAPASASVATSTAASSLLEGEMTLEKLTQYVNAQAHQPPPPTHAHTHAQPQQTSATDSLGSLSAPLPSEGADADYSTSDPAAHSTNGHAAIPYSTEARAPALGDHEVILGAHEQEHGHERDCHDCYGDHGEPSKGSITAKTLASDAAAECEENRPSGDYTTTIVLASQSALSSGQKRNRAAKLVSRIMSAKEADMPEAYAELAAFWSSDLGADVVGGCCGVSSVHVRMMSSKLEEQYSKKVQRWYKHNGLE
jgi:S-methylmethionine-dependent homocysteine/selenocysteine methylase